MNCQDFRELIDSYLSDELLTETNHGVLRHLEQCSSCRNVIEERRAFRGRLRSAVRNCPQLQLSGKFNDHLLESLRHAAMSRAPIKPSIWNFKTSLAAAAAGLLLIGTFGFFTLSNVIRSDERTSVTPAQRNDFYQKIALGDHKSCAIEHDLREVPVKIDTSQPQFAVLEAGVQIPLKEKFGRCELVDAHTCRSEGRSFTHMIFRPEGKTMSVLIMDLPEASVVDENFIDRQTIEGYQIAHFCVGRKAVFVISDLPEQMNFAAAEVVETPLREKFSQNARLNSDLGFGFQYAVYR